MAEQQQNYYDSIETDEFVMPNKFEVEIRLADNQVKIITVAVEKQQRPKAYSEVSETTAPASPTTTPLHRLIRPGTTTLIRLSDKSSHISTRLSQLR